VSIAHFQIRVMILDMGYPGERVDEFDRLRPGGERKPFS
jgi:hypothetical protein